jgi:hypothetical protein
MDHPPADSRPSLDISFLDLPSPFYSLSSSFTDRSPSVSPFSPSKSMPKLTSHKGKYQRSTTWWKPHRLPRVGERVEVEEGLLAQNGMESFAEEERWRVRQRRRGLLEVMGLFGVGLVMVVIVVVCLRMGGGQHQHATETAMAMMGEMGLSVGDESGREAGKVIKFNV